MGLLRLRLALRGIHLVNASLRVEPDGFSSQFIWIGARGGIRTHTGFNSHKALNLACLPISPPEQRGLKVDEEDTQPPESDQAGNRKTSRFSPTCGAEAHCDRGCLLHPVRQDGVHQSDSRPDNFHRQSAHAVCAVARPAAP